MISVRHSDVNTMAVFLALHTAMVGHQRPRSLPGSPRRSLIGLGCGEDDD